MGVKGWVIHDLRRWPLAPQRAGVPYDAVGLCLGHRLPAGLSAKLTIGMVS